MVWRDAIFDIEYRVSLAQLNAPRDIVTTAARLGVKAISVFYLVLLPVQIVTTAIGGCLIAISFGLLPVLLSLLWLPMFGLVTGSSWLWLKAWYLRPILLIPGLLVIILALPYIQLMPDPEKEAKHTKVLLLHNWPLLWYLLKPLPEYYQGQTDGN